MATRKVGLYLEGIEALVHSPAELSSSVIQWAADNQRFAGITWGLPPLDRRIIPLRPGRLAAIIGRPGSGKSSLMVYLARREAERLRAAGETDKVVVYCSWEQVVEEVEALVMSDGEFSASDLSWCRVDMEVLRRKAITRGNLPLWMIGYSLDGTARSSPELTLENVLRAVEAMEEKWHVRPVLVCFDYVQIIPARGYEDRVKRVAEMPMLVKRLCQRIGVAGVMGVQAGREVDSRKPQIPELGDCQWGSAIEQAVDLALATWRPSTTQELNSTVHLAGRDFTVTEELMFLRMLKQRGDQGRWTWPVTFQPQYLRLEEMELRREAPSRYDLRNEGE